MVKAQKYINGKIIIVNGSLLQLEEINCSSNRGLDFSRRVPNLQVIGISNSNFENKVEEKKLEGNDQTLTTLRYSKNKFEKNASFQIPLIKLKYQTEFFIHTREKERANLLHQQGTTRESKAVPPTTKVI